MIIPVNLGENSYDIIFERGALKNISDLLDLDRKVLVVTDDGVPAEYAETVSSACYDPTMVVMTAGEESKSFENLEKLCRVMLEKGFTRNDCIIAAGGGVVGDLAGFAASCYMRGIDFYNIPTTLLSQVDSSVGGKTAIDLDGIKNIVGSFYQPQKVIIDPEVLDTLSQRHFACGAAEIIKMAVCFDRKLFELIEEKGVKNCLEEAVAGALRIKASVVEKDEKEAGLRRVLNFGHTIGHGIESVTGLFHGECVAMGMLPMCSEKVRKRLADVLKREGLPVDLETAMKKYGSGPADLNMAEKIAEASSHDKKMMNGMITAVWVEEPGSFRMEKLDSTKLKKACMEVLS